MNKLFILCMLMVVALAAQKQKTNAQCEKKLKAKANCKQCTFAKHTNKACKNKIKAGDLNCVALKACYDDVKKQDAKAAKKAAKALADKYSKFCPTDKAQCIDRDPSCRAWAARKPDECTANPDWMLPNCAMSCCPICTGKNTLKNTGTCPPKGRGDLCVPNSNAQCHAWATKKPSECTKNKKWMRSNCMQSCCNVCKTDAKKCPTVKEACANKYAKPNKKKGNQKCVDWAKQGECRSNPNWMNSNCSKECCPVCAAKAPLQGAAPVLQQPVIRQAPLMPQPVIRQAAPYLPAAQPVLRQAVPVQQPVFGTYFG